MELTALAEVVAAAENSLVWSLIKVFLGQYYGIGGS